MVGLKCAQCENTERKAQLGAVHNLCIPQLCNVHCTLYELHLAAKSWVEQSSNSFVPSTTLSCCSPPGSHCLDLMLLNRIVLSTYCVLSSVVCIFVSMLLSMCLCLSMCVCEYACVSMSLSLYAHKGCVSVLLN